MDNNTLIISEKEQKAYLPYKYADLEYIYENSNGKYKSFLEIIKDLYILPLDNFKNSSFSRFRETFNLVVHKENSSIIKALDLALELMFKAELNPIIISACKNLNELDIYLAYLDENDTANFPCFDIKFEFAPDISKKQFQEFYLFV